MNHHHNHEHCVALSLSALENYCAGKQLKLTPLRRQVFSFLLAAHRAFGAYEILDQLRGAGFSAQPPVAYRALGFLVQHGFAHKIEKLNAFLACGYPGRTHHPAFFICATCRLVEEAAADSTVSCLKREAAKTGFQLDSSVIESIGICRNCQELAAL